MGSSWGKTSEMNSRWAKLLVSSLDIKEDGCLKTEIWLNEDEIRPEQARELDRQSWWACPHYLQRSCPSDCIRHINHAFIIIFDTRHTVLIMASLNVLVKLLPSSPFRLSPYFFIGVHRFLSAPCFYFHLLQFLGYARDKYLILQPRFYRLPRVWHSIRSHTFSRSVFCVLFPFCLQYFLSCILFFGCICFQCFPCYYFPASAPGISVLQGSLIPCRITGA